MTPRDLAMGIIFLSQTGMGILGNSSLLFHRIFLVFMRQTLRPKDLILKHLTLANSLAIISRGIPQTMAGLGLKCFLYDTGCKLVFYLYRVAWGISLYTTCLLSCFQALTIIPSRTRWMELKYRATEYIGPSCLLSWLVQLLVNIVILMRVAGPSNCKNITEMMNFGYCSGFVPGMITTPLYVFMLCLIDVLCLGLMAWASAFMVSTLYRHQRQVQYIHSTQLSPRLSPETRATQTILFLVCTFITFYSLSSILVLYIALFDDPSLWLINTIALIETCFPNFSPFVLISKNNFVSRLYFPCWRKRCCCCH